jgi:hypothetical protein
MFLLTQGDDLPKLHPARSFGVLPLEEYVRPRPVLVLLLVFVLLALFLSDVNTTAQALPPAPADCSGTLSESEINAVAQYFIYDPESDDPDWESCCADFNPDNYDALEAELYDLGWTPEPTPDSPIYPPDATPIPEDEDNLEGFLSGGVDLSRKLASGSNAALDRWLPSDSYLDDFSCPYSDHTCWKQMADKGARGVCPYGYDCKHAMYCQQTTTYCDSDPDIDWRCTYDGTHFINDPNTARVYSDGDRKLDLLLPSGGFSSDGHTNSAFARVCIANRTVLLSSIASVKAHLMFRHNPE